MQDNGMQNRQRRVNAPKEQVLCAWRKRYVRLTPEEWVRQQVLHTLEDRYAYPHALIGVEIAIEVAGLRKRCDAIVYDRTLRPLLLAEFKAENVPLTQSVFDQAAVYNRALHVPYLLVSNGVQTIIARVQPNRYDYLNEIPAWNQLLN